MSDLVIVFLSQLSLWQQALALGLLTWLLTACGAYATYLIPADKRDVLDAMLGFAGGIMLSASFWSLLLPAVEMNVQMGGFRWLPAIIGFVFGVVCMRALDIIVPHLHLGFKRNESEGVKTSWNRAVLFGLAVTIHNIPEGLAVGVAVGSASLGQDTSILAAISLTAGIGLQNIPEGFAVTAALRREGVSFAKSAFYGQLSALVEPLFSVLGAVIVVFVKGILPYALGFAAGAMLFIIVEEVIPESQRKGNVDISTLMFMLGFIIMTILDTAFS